MDRRASKMRMLTRKMWTKMKWTRSSMRNRARTKKKTKTCRVMTRTPLTKSNKSQTRQFSKTTN